MAVGVGLDAHVEQPRGARVLAQQVTDVARDRERIAVLFLAACGDGLQACFDALLEASENGLVLFTAVTAMLQERDEEARQTRAFIADSRRGLPVIVVGDFNMPTSSSIYRSYFDDFRNTFEAASWGCGYTAPCRPIRFWPANTPWQRIDHILTARPWQVLECHIGQRDGSDHRLIAATLQLRSPNETHADPESSAPVDSSDEVKALELGQ